MNYSNKGYIKVVIHSMQIRRMSVNIAYVRLTTDLLHTAVSANYGQRLDY